MFTCRISVHELVETSYLQGSLTSSGMSVQRAQLGARIHRQLQASRPDGYQSEVYFRHESVCDDITIVVEGRADGIYTKEDPVIIEEIKSTLLPYDQIDDSIFVHFAQCYVYAYFYLLQQEECASLIARVTYHQAESGQSKHFDHVRTREELTAFYEELIANYRKWAVLQRDLHIAAKTSAKAIAFPFESYRPHQREFAAWVYQSILRHDSLMVQAPTGIGKTVSTLFPALKAIGEGKCEKVFYLSAKSVTAKVARDTMRLFYDQQLSLKSVSLTAKDKMCLLEERNCEECPYADNYYGRVRPVLYALLQTQDALDSDCFRQVGKEHTLCPFELSLDASNYASLIICDYNYVFDPSVYLRRYFEDKGRYVFLIDEAHNLVDRARNMYSSELCRSDIETLRTRIPQAPGPLTHAIDRLLTAFARLEKSCNDSVVSQKEPMEDLYQLVNSVINECDAFLQMEKEFPQRSDVLLLYFQLIDFRRVYEYYDENFITWYAASQEDCRVRIFCMNPANQIQARIAHGISAIYFSATLSPSLYYAELLGEKEKAKRVALPSIFGREQYALLIHNAISTRYPHRRSSLPAIVHTIYHSVHPKPGNYIIFFPSYRYMEEGAALFQQHFPDMHVHLQKSGMNEEERHAFLERFEQQEGWQLYFCVLGGMFAEGIDFRGDRLIGAVIIGVGLPQINVESDFIRDHFNEQGVDGYHYAYTYPGMNKVLQAMGRVIRTKKDKGILVLIDDRYGSALYRSLFPAHYRHARYVQDALTIEEQLTDFWNDSQQSGQF